MPVMIEMNQPPSGHHLAPLLLPAIVGALIGWAGNALTLSGRVAAIEASLVRIEARLYSTQQPQKPQEPAK